MALQLEVTKISVTDAGPVYSGVKLDIVMRLKCWTEGDNIETDLAVIDRDFNGEYSDIVGLTVQEQVNKMMVEIHEKMQAAIDKYKRELVLFSNEKLDTAVITIQSNLVG